MPCALLNLEAIVENIAVYAGSRLERNVLAAYGPDYTPARNHVVGCHVADYQSVFAQDQRGTAHITADFAIDPHFSGKVDISRYGNALVDEG